MKKNHLFILLFGMTALISTPSFCQNCSVFVYVTDNGDGTSTLFASGSGSGTLSYSWDNGSSGDQITVNNDGAQYCVTRQDDYIESV